MRQKKCKKCGIIFERPKRLTGSFRISQKQWEKKLYCSCSCVQKDKKVSIITKKRISEKHKKLKHHSGRFQKGHRINIGKVQSLEVKTAKSKLMKNKKRPEFAGENNPN